MLRSHSKYNPQDVNNDLQEEGRLPDGMERVGYDADTEVYTYQDSIGYYYQGEPGTRYGLLRPTGTRSSRQQYSVAMPFIDNDILTC